jgi:hypothetical protein
VLGRGYVEPPVHRQHLHRKRVQLDAAPGERAIERHVGGKGRKGEHNNELCFYERKSVSLRGRVAD